MADITQACQGCGKKFLVIEQEQAFLKKKNLPLPILCPLDRQQRRLEKRGERALYRTTCQQCGVNMIATYDPKSVKSKVLCKKCYLEYFEKHDPLLP